jgi:hypothetical protein
VPLVSDESRSLCIQWLQRIFIFGTDIIEFLWHGGGFTVRWYVAIFFAGVGFGWSLEVLFLGLFQD